MHTPDTIDKRLTELEIKASFSEDLADQLNQVIIGQQQQLDRLVQQVRLLRQQLLEKSGDDPARPADNLPPHY